MNSGNDVMDMQQFKVCYIPGGMGISHSAWWVCVTVIHCGRYIDLPVQYLRKADYA